MKMLRWSLAVLGAFFAIGAGTVEAQTVVVEGGVQVQQGYGQPPQGYQTQPVYGQPVYQTQPQYAPTYQQPQRRVQYVDQEESIMGLWLPGIIAFAAGYALTATLAWTFSYNYDYYTFCTIPLVGPWIALSSYGITGEEIAGAVLGGAVQAAGLTMFILGLTLRQTVRVAVYTLDEHDERSPQLALQVQPQVGGGTLGLSLSHF